MSKHITVELTDSQARHFAELSEIRNAPVEALLAEIVQRHLDDDRWFDGEVQKGIDAADRGDLVTQDEVVAGLEALKAELLGHEPCGEG